MTNNMKREGASGDTGAGGLRRRDTIGLIGGVAAGAALGTPVFADSRMRPLEGVIPVAQTPYDQSGAIAWAELAEQTRIYERCGVQGLIWPAGGSDVHFMTKEERIQGMEVVAEACRPLDLACILAIHARSTEEMLELAEIAIGLEPDALYVASPAGELAHEELLNHFLALANLTSLPLVVFGNINSSPSVDLVAELARRIPNPVHFRTDGMPVREHMLAAVAEKPALKGVFGASAGSRWAFEHSLGSDGLMTHYGMFGDVKAKLWQAWEAGDEALALDIFSKLLLLFNLDTPLLAYKEEQVPGLKRYILHKRGWFSTMVARQRDPETREMIVVEVELTPEERAEVDRRFAQLQPWLAV